MTISADSLNRHLYDQSILLTRAANSLVAASDQLLEAHGSDYAIAAEQVRHGAMLAMHAALSAYELIGSYELAAWIQGREALKG